MNSKRPSKPNLPDALKPSKLVLNKVSQNRVLSNSPDLAIRPIASIKPWLLPMLLLKLKNCVIKKNVISRLVDYSATSRLVDQLIWWDQTCDGLQKESFGRILLNPEFICVIGTVPTYLGNWGKRVNFGNGVAKIQQKYEREREKVGERKFEFR